MVPARRFTPLFTFLVLSLVVTAPALGQTATPTPVDSPLHDSTGVPPVIEESRPIQTITASSNNSSTVQHENPASVDRDGDTTALQQWFARQFQSRLQNSSVNLSQGEYDKARALLGDEYNETVAKYGDLAEQTSSSGDNSVATNLQNATEHHREYVATVKEYRQTRAAYQRAKQSGNETRTRRFARELERLATEINQTGTTLTRRYDTVANATESNLTGVQHTITNSTENVLEQQSRIRRAEFTRTAIAVDRHRSQISFQEPLTVEGTLTAANGTHLGNRTVAVTLGNRTVRTTTTANGTFTLSARPTLVPRGTQTIVVRYLPRNASMYLGTRTAITVNVTAVTPTVTLTQSPDSGQFGNVMTIKGNVRVPNASATVDDVPVQVLVNSTSLGTTQTTANGTFTLTTTVPASAPTGRQPLRVLLPLTDRALTPTTTTASLAVRPTSTQLTMIADTATTSANRTHFRGHLRTKNGTLLQNRTLALRVDGQTVATAVTNENGAYATTLNTSVLRATTNASSANVTALFAGSGNLNVSQAATAVQVRASGGLLQGLPVSPLVVVATGVLGLGGLGVLARQRLNAFDQQTASESPRGTEDPTTATSNAVPTTTIDSESILTQATAQLKADNPDDAVALAYGAVRHQLTAQADTLESTTAQTHWEFYNAYRNENDLDLGPNRTSDLESLTEAFERAQFTTGRLTPERANEAIETATTLSTTVGTASPTGNTDDTDDTDDTLAES